MNLLNVRWLTAAVALAILDSGAQVAAASTPGRTIGYARYQNGLDQVGVIDLAVGQFTRIHAAWFNAPLDVTW